MITTTQFQNLILSWFDQHGRKTLPWQQNKTAYRVWISEIMLQQTQVATVIPYFERFMQSFPNIESLAKAGEDEVLHHWAGLGYYSRARNLKRAANFVVEKFAGKFPETLADLKTLPGIGPSTAGAILAIAFNQQATILDGNVKRVLARFHCVEDAIDETRTENKLWEFAKSYTPKLRVADYTQAMMDLGATLCVRGKPKCTSCPLNAHCKGLHQNLAASLPKKRAKQKIPTRTATFIVLEHQGQILLKKRPDFGIWGGLWSFPELPGKPDDQAIKKLCREWQLKIEKLQLLPSFKHTFSHYHLNIFPVRVKVCKLATKVMEAEQQIWYNPLQPETIGLPAPVQAIIEGLTDADDSLRKIE